MWEPNRPNMEESKELLQSYKSRLLELEDENRQLRKVNRNLEESFAEVIEHIYFPMVLVDSVGDILFNNQAFVDLLDYGARQLSKEINGLKSHNVNDILNEEMRERFKEYSVNHGSGPLSIFIKGSKYMLNIYDIRKGKSKLLLFRNTADEQLGREELLLKLQEIIDRNMKMVQNIGFLMGEETSNTTSVLNSIIKYLK